MKLNSWVLIVLFLLVACKSQEVILSATSKEPLHSFVNPFVGTGGHGHTFPGATMPFGMMQLSPDTRLDGWDGCSGYHYSDSYIYGFSHTHLSGTGVSDYGDVLLMPTNEVIFHNGADGKKGYRSKFSHDKEKASPGFYQVHLEDPDVKVSLTVAERSGKHRYEFAKGSRQVVILDLVHRDEVLDAKVTLHNNSSVSGHRFSKAWATDQRLYFDMEFSRPYTKVTFLDDKKTGKKVKAAFEFDASESHILEIKIGISPVDDNGALHNWQLELENKSFETIKKQAEAAWERQLSKIVVETYTEEDKINFYTALYHTMLAPNLYQDIDGRYRGMDLKVHLDEYSDYYTVFSLWDTYRATHPLYTIIEQQRTNNFVDTFIKKYQEGGIMPIWDLSANYTGCMIGYHAVPVIADAYLKGIRGYDVNKAFEAMKHSATRDKLGLDSYKKYGFIPVEKESESVSKTLEYSYDDWTIAQMAKAMGKTEDYKTYIERGQYYKNVFDPKTQFMRGRFRNTWFAPFDPYEVNFNYTEANAWQYSFYAPQDISGHINLMGGKRNFEKKLDELFTAEAETSGRNQADITGLIGQYAHGNEPSHHMAYLYNFVNKPVKTQRRVRQILRELYKNAPDGISGNEDCGQMSAWYVFSALGFYPVTPGSNQYVIGSPLVKKATINLENGKKFTIAAPRNSDKHIYIKKALLNGKEHPQSFLQHKDIMNGGTLFFDMRKGRKTWATKNENIPTTSIQDHLITTPPFIQSGDIAFKGSTRVSLASLQSNATIYYTTGSEFQKYTRPFTIEKNALLKTYASIAGKNSAVISTQFYEIDPNIKIELKTQYANQYNAGGNNALIDGILGTEDFRTGTWQGYWNENVEAIVNLGEEKELSEVGVNFLRDQRSWIFLPTKVEIYHSKDGKSYTKLHDWQAPTPENTDQVAIRTVKSTKPVRAKYIKVFAKKMGKLPVWHLGYKHDGRSWIFIDEIQIK